MYIKYKLYIKKNDRYINGDNEKNDHFKEFGKNTLKDFNNIKKM